MHLEDITERSNVCPLFVVQGKSGKLAALVSAHFFHPKPEDKFVNRLM